MSQTTLQTATNPPPKKARAKSSNGKTKSNGKNRLSSRSRSKSNGKNGNGHGRLTMAELQVTHAELVKQHMAQSRELERLQAEVGGMGAELEKIHRYLDALHAPPGMPASVRAVDEVFIWFCMVFALVWFLIK